MTPASPPPAAVTASVGGGALAPGLAAPTLDEPVATTVMRDLRQVATKLRYVLLPAGHQSETLKELRNWDLWGPLLLCLTLSIILSVGARAGQASLVFASVFVIVWAGAAVVTVNAQLLGGSISFFQSVCVLGYCIFPLVLASLLATLWEDAIYRTLLVITALVWSTRGEGGGGGGGAEGSGGAWIWRACLVPSTQHPTPHPSRSLGRLHGRARLASPSRARRLPDSPVLHRHRVRPRLRGERARASPSSSAHTTLAPHAPPIPLPLAQVARIRLVSATAT